MTKVKCSVETCEYWGEGNECHAEEIWVRSETSSYEAETNGQTFCETFEPSQNDLEI